MLSNGIVSLSPATILKLQTSGGTSQSQMFDVASGATVFVEIVTVNSNNKAYNFVVSVRLFG